MSNNQMVSVPRDELEAACQRFAKAQIFDFSRRLRALLAQPAEQHQGDPLALVVPDECPHIIVFDDADRANEHFCGSGARPAALRRYEQISQSWNAHLFARVARNSRDDRYPSATVADPAEVERLRAELENSYTVAEHERLVAKGQEINVSCIRTLRAKLAEQAALLREAMEILQWDENGTPSVDVAVRISQLLSASAEPGAPIKMQALGQPFSQILADNADDLILKSSAPAEIDERAEFESWCAVIGYTLKTYEHGNGFKPGYGSELFSAWQARATLERNT